MKKIYSLLILSGLICYAGSTFGQTSSYTTVSTFTYTVPAGCTAVGIDMAGAQGGFGYTTWAGGLGGRVQATLAVSGGQVLTVYVGGTGGNACYCGTPAGGANGSAGGAGGGSGSGGGAGGGGASDIRTGGTALANRVLVAAGGGGGAYDCGEAGGAGGGLTGANGVNCGSYSSAYDGAGGSQTAGGLGATSGGVSGGIGYGGAAYSGLWAGGGGGGYYGGGGGYYGSGGGGSSYISGAGVSGATTTSGYRSGTGYVNITPLLPTVTASPASLAFGSVTVGGTSSSIYFTLSGSILTSGGSLTITPPANFRISPDYGTTWYTNSSPYTYSYTGTAFSGVVFTAQFLPTAATTYSSNIAITGGGLTSTYNVAVTGTGASACSGTPTAGTASITPTSGNATTSFTLSLTGATSAGGITYQWQSGPSATGPFTNIPGANTPTYIYTGLTGNTWFQCVETCPTYGPGTSTTASATFVMPATSCTPSCYYVNGGAPSCGSSSTVYYNTSSGYYYYLAAAGYPVSITGASGSISDANPTAALNYTNNTSTMSVTFNVGGSYTCTMGAPNGCYMSGSIWIDFNDNGIFETSELVGGYAHSGVGGCPTTRPTPTITIPAGVAPGAHRMRIEADYDGNNGPGASGYYPCYPQMNPCPSQCTSSPYVYWADTRDYTAIIVPPTPTVTATAVAGFGNVTVGTSSVPVGFSTISGANLVPTIGPLTITAPSGFQVSTNGSSWANTATIVYTSGTLSNTNFYVQFNPTSASAYSGNVTITGGGLPSAVNVAVTGTGNATVCSGTPTSGSVVLSPTSGGSTTAFSLSLTGTSSVGGLVYQWQSSPNGTTWTNIAAGIYSTYSFTGINATTYYRCIVTCGTGASSTTTSVTATYVSSSMAASSCTPTFSSASAACSTYYMWMRIQALTGASGSIADATACSGTGYENLASSMSVTLNAGTTYSCTLNTGTSYPGSMGAQVWVDFNNNGIFETSESVGGYTLSSTSSTSPVITLTIPSGVPSGTFRMRVVGNYNCCGATSYPAMNPCPTTAITYGDVRDYTAIIFSGTPPCSGTPNPGVVSAAPLLSCSSSSVSANVFNVGETTSPGITYQWQSSTTSATTGFTNITGATNAVYLATLASAGTVYYRDVVTCGASSANSPSQGIILSAPTTAITGNANLCVGLSNTYSCTPSGGTWSSNNTAITTIGSATGIGTGVAVGTAILTYLLPSGCFSTYAVTVNAQPAAITGTAVVCPAASTTLGDATAGGTWSSSNTAIAAIGSSTGIATGVSGGTATISYTAPTGCFSTLAFTVNALAPITGVSSLCSGFGTTLTDATAGGVWSSSNTSVMTIGSSTGVVTSLSVGTSTISYVVSSIGCTAIYAMAVVATPSPFLMTGGGDYCAGGSGVVVGLIGSNSGVTYQLFNGATPIVPTITGAGFGFNFPAQTAAGTYGIVANPGSPCAVTMTGTATIIIDPLPTPFTVSGGGAYCAGGTGLHVYLNSSTIGINYQLFANTGSGPSPVGGVVPGTSAALDFGLFAPAVSTIYTVGAINTSTSCVNNMGGSVTIAPVTLPTAFSMTPATNGYCTGGTGATVGLNGSQVGVNYQLLLGGGPIGAPFAGTGFAFNFTPPVMAGGVYTAVATSTTTGCSTAMTSTTTISIYPLPTVFTVTGGGAYCSGGTGLTVGLNGSQIGVNYQLYNGVTAVGAAVAGTGVSLSWGPYTTTGSYTVIATSGNGCVSNMSSSANIAINPLPTVFSITSSATSYCAGGSGVHIGLGSSVVGTNYTLLNGATIVGALAGTGAPLDFGLITAAGTYSVAGTIVATGCTGAMSGTVNLTINPLPTVFSVTGGGNYCAGGTGVVIGLSSSTSGVNYQLFRGGIAVGTAVAGTGSAISFGLQTVSGAYTVVATNATTTCTNNMTGSATVGINPLPTVFSVTGGGGYCAGGSGTHVGLSGSDVGINYQLMLGSTSIGGPSPGIGAALDFGILATAGTYTVTANNPLTTCTSNMSGSAVIVVNPLPLPMAMTGGGSYCAGGTGVAIGLSSSVAGVNYQLYRGGVATGSPVAGTGSAISFGLQTAAGTYTSVATDGTTGCTNNMTGSIIVGINPLPIVYSVVGGGNVCAGGTGVNVSITGSAIGVNYQLYVGGVATGLPVPGTGVALSFGPHTVGGVYTVIATNPTTTCVNNMSGSVTVTVTPLPGLYLVTGGGNFCAGGTGVHVGLSGSATGINYQIYIGGTLTGAPMPGSGAALDFGAMTTGGVYTILATNTTTGCAQYMTGSASVVVNPLPSVYAVAGGGNYCPGGPGVNVGLTGSAIGITYQLFNGFIPAGSPVAGTGTPISFGLQTAIGIYTVLATNTATGCTANMSGSVTIGVYPLPVIYNVTGGGNYCPAGTGVHVGVSGSGIGVNYQLYRGGVATGSPVAGTGFGLDFGLQTTPGTYTIIGTNTATGCNVSMNGNAIVGISPLPAAHNITGGGNYCTGGTGVHIGLNGSDAGVYYQLYNGITLAGSPMAGTGLPLDFGLQTTAGTYTITGTGVGSTCTNTMTGSVTIVINPLPTVYNVTGGGNYCTGGTGADVMLSGSSLGTDYQLYVGGTATGSPVSGTGSLIDFGMQTAAGIYTVVATNSITLCTNNMSGSVTVVVNPLPTAFTVTGGGNYCLGGPGVHVMISGSDVGTQYQLWLGGTIVGAPVAGTGFGLDFGLQTTTGIYTVSATNTLTTCTGNMSGSVTIGISTLPAVYNVSGSAPSYCAGGSGIDIALSGSDIGTNYQLYNGLSAVGSPVAGTGVSLDFGLQTATGTYTVVGIIGTSTCTNNMAGAASITISPLPVAFNVTGGGGYCNGGTGVNIGLSGSNVGVIYQLLSSGVPVGGTMAGTGSPLNFGLHTAAGTYTVMATNTTTTCTHTMTGSATVVANPLPAGYTVTGGGSYCTGTGGVPVGLSGSASGINYQLLRGGVPVTILAGTGFALDFGAQTVAGNYTVAAINPSTTCTRTMTGSVTVSSNPSPSAYAVIGGGNYCPGGAGVHVGLGGSNTGISYQLYIGGTITGAPIAGTGYAVDFGLQTAAGTYTVRATNITSGCTNAMTGSVMIMINPLPAVYGVVGGGSYCAGGPGVHIGLNGSATGISYQLYNGLTPAGVPVIGTGSPLDLGLQTVAGTSYTVIGSDGSTSCSSNMSGSASVSINALVTPDVTISTGVGDTVCSGHLITFTAMAVNGGGSPLYQWTVNGSVTGAGSIYSYMPADGDMVGVRLTSNATCATPATASATIAMNVNTEQSPVVTVTANPGTMVCSGTAVTFTAAPLYGGSAPTYSWIVNGINSGTASTLNYTPLNGDVVYCIMGSNYHCRLANSATSTQITMQVDMPVMPVVTVTPNPGGNIPAGHTVTFTAAVTSGGSSPSFQWSVNSNPVAGATMQTYTTTSLSNNDVVSCQVTAGGACPGMVGTNSVTVHIIGVGVNPVTISEADIRLIPNPNSGTFTIKGNTGSVTSEEVSLEITDMVGQVIYNSKVMTHNGDINERIQLNNTVANGMYLLNIRTTTGNKVFHIVVEQ